jgi:hypothetical protein
MSGDKMSVKSGPLAPFTLPRKQCKPQHEPRPRQCVPAL